MVKTLVAVIRALKSMDDMVLDHSEPAKKKYVRTQAKLIAKMLGVFRQFFLIEMHSGASDGDHATPNQVITTWNRFMLGLWGFNQAAGLGVLFQL
jgi:hypothetical protein